jgi:hypothetical protein
MVALRRLVRSSGPPEERSGGVVAVPAGSNAYNSLWQVRNDAWSTLEESTAQLALACTQQLQACVVRRRFAHRSRHDTSALRQFVSLLGSDDLMDHSPDERAQVLARSLARIRPELDLYLMTEIAIEDMAGRLSHHFRRIFHTREGSLELHLSILDGIAARVLVPGQVFSPQILAFMRSLDTPEVHGYRADLGYRVYVEKALEIAATAWPAPPPDPPDLAGPTGGPSATNPAINPAAPPDVA